MYLCIESDRPEKKNKEEEKIVHFEYTRVIILFFFLQLPNSFASRFFEFCFGKSKIVNRNNKRNANIRERKRNKNKFNALFCLFAV